MIECGESAPVIRVGNLEAQRDVTDVRDVVRAYMGLMERGTPATVYNVCSGVARSMRAILESLLALSSVSVRIETDPAKLRPVDMPYHVGNATLLRGDTDWRPEIAFEQCLAGVLDRVAHAARRAQLADEREDQILRRDAARRRAASHRANANIPRSPSTHRSPRSSARMPHRRSTSRAPRQPRSAPKNGWRGRTSISTRSVPASPCSSR